MTEVQKIGELGHETREPRGTRMGLDAIERAFRDDPLQAQQARQFQAPATPVEVALYVNGRLVTTKTDSTTVFRVLAILTGLDQ